MSDLDLDAIEARMDSILADYVGPPIPHEAIAVILDIAQSAVVDPLVAEVRELRATNDRLATLLGRRMTGAEISAALSHMIETGELEIPPLGSPTLSSEEVRRELGIEAQR